MKITPKPGDYVRTEDMTEEQYHAVAKVFMDAGFYSGEYPDCWQIKARSYFGISACGSELFHSGLAGKYSVFLNGRELFLSDLLGDESVVWDGEGLPSVGTKCELAAYCTKFEPAAHAEWKPVTIVAYTKEYVVVDLNDKEVVLYLNGLKFRPLKSEREIAIEEMVSGVPHCADDAHGVKLICNQLYDAGYRKLVK